MAVNSRDQLKGYLQSFDEPTQQQLWNLVDSFFHLYDGNIIKRIEDVGTEGIKQIVLSDNTTVQVAQPSVPPQTIAHIGGWRTWKHPANSILNQVETNDIIEGYFSPEYFSKFKVLDASDLANLNNLEDLNEAKTVNTNTVKFDRPAGYFHEALDGGYLQGDIIIDPTNARNGVGVKFKIRTDKRPQITGAEYEYHNNIVTLDDYVLWMIYYDGVVSISIPKGVAGGSSSNDSVRPATPEITSFEIVTDGPNQPEITEFNIV